MPGDSRSLRVLVEGRAHRERDSDLSAVTVSVIEVTDAEEESRRASSLHAEGSVRVVRFRRRREHRRSEDAPHALRRFASVFEDRGRPEVSLFRVRAQQAADEVGPCGC